LCNPYLQSLTCAFGFRFSFLVLGRLKKVQAGKEKRGKAMDAEKALKEAKENGETADQDEGTGGGGGDLLNDKDEDVIF
jgi:hypothetical protein